MEARQVVYLITRDHWLLFKLAFTLRPDYVVKTTDFAFKVGSASHAWPQTLIQQQLFFEWFGRRQVGGANLNPPWPLGQDLAASDTEGTLCAKLPLWILKSQHWATEGNGEERNFLSLISAVFFGSIASSYSLASVFFCSMLICEITVFKWGHMLHYLQWGLVCIMSIMGDLLYLMDSLFLVWLRSAKWLSFLCSIYSWVFLSCLTLSYDPLETSPNTSDLRTVH